MTENEETLSAEKEPADEATAEESRERSETEDAPNEEAAETAPEAEEENAEENNPGLFPIGEQIGGDFSNFFSGKTYINHIVPSGAAVLNMTFAPGCRSVWHVHHNGGQYLLVTGGAGWYQEEGKEPQPLRPGDIVRVPAEIKHWHGAARDSWLSHLLIPVAAPGASNAFLEAVDDKDYDALPPSSEETHGVSIMSHLGGMAKFFGKQ